MKPIEWAGVVAVDRDKVRGYNEQEIGMGVDGGRRDSADEVVRRVVGLQRQSVGRLVVSGPMKYLQQL